MSDERPVKAILTWDLNGPHELLLKEGDTAQCGREADNDVVLDIPQISRHHAVIAWRDGAYELQDLGSMNGTMVNDTRIGGPYVLEGGDRITLFNQDLTFTLVKGKRPPMKHGTLQTLVVAPDAPHPRLIISAGSQEGREIRLVPGKMTIGRMTARSENWDIALQDRAISRPHACIESGEDGFTLSDLGSVNGTLLNGVELAEPTLLKDGDVLHIGETTLIFRAA